MNIYVETNFVLELSLMQEEYQSCQEIWTFCADGHGKLILPAYSLVEPYETLIRRDLDRRDLVKLLDRDLKQLARSSYQQDVVRTQQSLLGLLIESGSKDIQRLRDIQEKLIARAELIALYGGILSEDLRYYELFQGKPQDAVVFASIVWHLKQNPSVESCFITRNARDFSDVVSIKKILEEHHCRLITKFADGLKYLQNRYHD